MPQSFICTVPAARAHRTCHCSRSWLHSPRLSYRCLCWFLIITIVYYPVLILRPLYRCLCWFHQGLFRKVVQDFLRIWGVRVSGIKDFGLQSLGAQGLG